MSEDFIPYRLCCGKQHWGAVCPDGKVMCCLCFERVEQDNLSVDEEGCKTDVCIPCREMEEKWLIGRHKC